MVDMNDIANSSNGIDPVSGTKQTSWFTTNVDFENSFKYWFALQWQNKYIQIFVPMFIATIVELFKINSIIDAVSDNWADGTMGGIFTIMAAIIPLAICVIIGYKGFYQFFIDMKNGTSR